MNNQGAVKTSMASKILGIPFNRIVAFLGPYIAVISGALATWLLVHLHVLALFHISHDQLASVISQVVVFGVTAGLTWLGHQKWLIGHQIELAATLNNPGAALNPPGRTAPVLSSPSSAPAVGSPGSAPAGEGPDSAPAAGSAAPSPAGTTPISTAAPDGEGTGLSSR